MGWSSGALIVARWRLVEPAGWLLVLGMLILRCWLAVASGRGIAVKHTAEHLAKLPPESGQELHGAHILGLPRLRVALLRVSLLWVLWIALGRLAILWWRGCLLWVAVILGKGERRA